MAAVTKTVYIVARHQSWSAEEPWTLSFWDFKPDEEHLSGLVYIGEAEVTFDMPPHEVLATGMVRAYRREQQRIRAEAQQKVDRVQDEIQKLLALEFKPEAV